MACVHISTIIVQEGISFEDVQAFTELVENISDVEMALSMYMAAGASITPGILYTLTLSLSAFFLSSSLVYTHSLSFFNSLSLSLSFFFHRPWYIYLTSLSAFLHHPSALVHTSLCLFLSSPLVHLSLHFPITPGITSAFFCVMCGHTLCKNGRERERRYTRSDGEMQREVYQGR